MNIVLTDVTIQKAGEDYVYIDATGHVLGVLHSLECKHANRYQNRHTRPLKPLEVYFNKVRYEVMK